MHTGPGSEPSYLIPCSTSMHLRCIAPRLPLIPGAPWAQALGCLMSVLLRIFLTSKGGRGEKNLSQGSSECGPPVDTGHQVLLPALGPSLESVHLFLHCTCYRDTRAVGQGKTEHTCTAHCNIGGQQGPLQGGTSRLSAVIKIGRGLAREAWSTCISQTGSAKEFTQHGPVPCPDQALVSFSYIMYVTATVCKNTRRYHMQPNLTDGSWGSSRVAVKVGFQERTQKWNVTAPG